MRINSINTLMKAMFACALLVASGTASAAMISGDITFSGDWDSAQPLGSTMALTFPGSDAGIDGANGDFSGISQGDIGTIGDLDLSGALNGSVFYSVGGFDFTLDGLSVDLQTADFLLVSGTGFATGNGFMPTPVDFVFSAQTLGGVQSFSAGFTAAPVPVPGALILFGSAFAALGLRRK